MTTPDESIVDVLIVGAGPTGLALAAELRAHRVSFRIVDRAPDAVHESRSLGIHARTLEVLLPLGLTRELVASGKPATELRMHFRKSTADVKLFDEGFDETAYPYILFLSQATTERILVDQLARAGITIERGLTLQSLSEDADLVTSTLRTDDGDVTIRSRYVVGCDGAHSAVRHAAGIEFVGTAHPQIFVIADLEVDNIETGRVHVYVAEAGMLMFFPLGTPATWRMIVLVPPGFGAPTLENVQAFITRYTADPVTVRDPVWLTTFSVQSRRAERYRSGRVFLAGDAAHIHSPAGAQGMNTGIQDAVNLGWKLALVSRGLLHERALDSYEAERAPVARSVLRMTDLAFIVATSSSRMIRFLRPRVAASVVPIAVRMPWLRRIGFRAISQLGIRYRRSPLSVEGRPRIGPGPRAGDRFPDASIEVDGASTTMHRRLSPTAFQLVLCGPAESWMHREELDERWSPVVRVSRLSDRPGAGVWTDDSHVARRRLGLRAHDTAHYLVRPDGYIAYRARGDDLAGLREYLAGL